VAFDDEHLYRVSKVYCTAAALMREVYEKIGHGWLLLWFCVGVGGNCVLTDACELIFLGHPIPLAALLSLLGIWNLQVLLKSEQCVILPQRIKSGTFC